MSLPVGVYPASITPFDERGKIDYPAVARLLAHFQTSGCSGVLMAGTTGEGPSLSAVEKRDLLREAVRLGQGMPIIGGIATSSLEEAVWLCRQGHDSGATAMLVMPPSFFSEATEAGLIAWFSELLDRSPLPILLYNFPKRTGIPLTPSLVAALADHPKMAGIKDSSGDANNLSAFVSAAPGKTLFVGDETLLLQALALGWSGTFSGSANSVPTWLVQIVKEWSIDRESAETKHALLLPTLLALRSAPQPATHKQVLTSQGVIPSGRLRLPLVGTEALPEVVQRTLIAIGLLMHSI